MQNLSLTLFLITITIIITIIVLGIYGINKAAKVASEAVDKVAGSPGLTSTIGEIGKMVKEINDDKVIGNLGTVMKGIEDKDILSGVDASLDNVNSIVTDVRNTQLIPTAEGAIQDVRTLMAGIDDASMRQFNQIVQNCGDGITMQIPKGKLANFTVDVPGIIGEDIAVEVPSQDMTMKLNFPGCKENFNKEAFSKVIQDTFKTKNLPRRFEREFHIDANGHIRTGVKDKNY